MDRSDALYRPPSLRAFLDAGCDLGASEIWMESLAELVFLQLPFIPVGERRHRARRRRNCADLLLAGESTGRDPAIWWAQILFEQWSAELYEDPILAERLREALPAHLADRHRALSDLYRRPHPLEVRLPDSWWNCQNCGAVFDEGEQEAVTVTGREGHSELEYDITYCAACIGMVAEVSQEAGEPT